MLAQFVNFVILLASIANVASANSPEEREFVYVQKTGKFLLDGETLAVGYAGKGDGKNNPAMEHVRNVGPIPRGLYAIGRAIEYKGMPSCFVLTPINHDARGRSGFLIHGDSLKNPGAASEGCIILATQIRKRIADSGITRLRVIRE